MNITFLKDFRNFKKNDAFSIIPNTVNYWVGANATGKSTLASLILTALKKKNPKLIAKHNWMATITDKKVIGLEGWENFTGCSFFSDKLRTAQSVDMDSLLGMGLQRIWASEGQNAQMDVMQLSKHLNDPNHLYILDEIDGHLDYRCKYIYFMGFCKKVKGTAILISHDPFFLAERTVFDFGDKKTKVGREYYKEEQGKI